MKLAIHSDASYLSEPQVHSRAGGHFFVSNEATIPANNGEAVYIRIVLPEMGHKQPVTPLQMDNGTAEGVCNGKIQPKQTKAIDMRFHWLRDRQCQEQFRIFWRPGKSNHINYWTNIIQQPTTNTQEENS